MKHTGSSSEAGTLRSPRVIIMFSRPCANLGLGLLHCGGCLCLLITEAVLIFFFGSVKGNTLGVGQGRGDTSWTAGKIGLLMKYELCHCAGLRTHQFLLKVQSVPTYLAVLDGESAQSCILDYLSTADSLMQARIRATLSLDMIKRCRSSWSPQ